MSDLDQDLATRYNYDAFVKGKYDQFMTFDQSPKLGEPSPDATLMSLDERQEITLSSVWKQHALTVVEFGSYT